MPRRTHAAVRGDVDTELEAADRLRHAVAKLARLMRQQDDSELGATAIATLVTVRKFGPITLGDLAAHERVSRPTMTKLVEKLEQHGLVERQADPNDRRVVRAAITPAGTRHLSSTRNRRTAWLAGRLGQLDDAEYRQLETVIATLESIIGHQP